MFVESMSIGRRKDSCTNYKPTITQCIVTLPICKNGCEIKREKKSTALLFKTMKMNIWVSGDLYVS